MTTINLRYLITDHGITLNIDDTPPYKIESDQYVVSTKSWPKPIVTLKVSPRSASQAAPSITILVTNEVPEEIPRKDGVATSDYKFAQTEGIKLTVTVQGTRAQATLTIYAIPGDNLELAKLPPPKNPNESKPSTVTPTGPGDIRVPEPDRKPKVELKNSGTRLNAELDDLRK